MIKRDVLKFASTTALLASLLGCTHIVVDDCPAAEHWYRPSVLGKDTPRVRSSEVRMELANQYPAAKRFAPYALMSAYAYFDEPGCTGKNSRRTDKDDAVRIREQLTALGEADTFVRRQDLEVLGGCEDDTGLMYHVWQSAPRSEIVIAFRGTSTLNDWWYGNLWPVSRILSRKTQYSEVQQHVAKVIALLNARQLPGATIVVTGHSLGGGLAQHALYSYPNSIRQAIVFDPSLWTGYTSIEGAERVVSCNCANDLGAEAPIIRIYESYEILSNLRIFHKMLFPSHLHIQEVRFAYEPSRIGTAGHSMADLATAMGKDARDLRAKASGPWFSSPIQACTEQFEKRHVASCTEASQSKVCQAPANSR